MKFKKILFLAPLIIAGTVMAVVGTTGSSIVDTGATCDHEGYHYTSIDTNFVEDGHQEFWTCCKCHETFMKEPDSGVFVEQDRSLAEGGIPDVAETYRTVVDSIYTGSAVNDVTGTIEAPGNFQHVYEVTGQGIKSPFAFDLERYTEIYFTFLCQEDNTWVEITDNTTGKAINGNFQYSSTSSWANFKIVKENDGTKTYYKLFDKEGAWSAFNIIVTGTGELRLEDYIGIKLTDGKTFYTCEVIAKEDPNYVGAQVASRYIAGTYDIDRGTSMLAVSAWHAKTTFNALPLNMYEMVYFNFRYDGNSNPFIFINKNGTTAGDWGCSVNSWHNVTLAKSDDLFYLFIDGAMKVGSLDITNLSDLYITAGVACQMEISSLFGILADGYEVVSEQAISNTTYSDDYNAYLYTSDKHYAKFGSLINASLALYDEFYTTITPLAASTYAAVLNGSTELQRDISTSKQYMTYTLSVVKVDTTYTISFAGKTYTDVSLADGTLSSIKISFNSTAKGKSFVIGSLVGRVVPTSKVLSKVVEKSAVEGTEGSSTRFVGQDSRLTTSYQLSGTSGGKKTALSDFDISSYTILYFYAIATGRSLNVYKADQTTYVTEIPATNTKITLTNYGTGWNVSFLNKSYDVEGATNLNELLSFQDWITGSKGYFSELLGF